MPVLVLAGLLLALATHVAISATGFAVAGFRAGPGTGPLTALFFAPFALVALLAPLAAGPMLRRRHPAALRARARRDLIVLVSAAVVGVSVLQTLPGGPADPALSLAHGLAALYACAAAWWLHRRDSATDTPEAPCDA